MSETWRAVPGYEGEYEVSDLGNVRSLNRSIVTKRGVVKRLVELAGTAIDYLVVRHRCDNPPCVNPAHLTTGTQRDNVADMVSRGRAAKGEARPTTLTEQDVREIRRRAELGELHRDLAAEYGTARSNITRIVNRNGWSHVD